MKINDHLVNYRDLGEGRFSIDLGQQNLKTTAIELNDVAVSLDDSGLENVMIEDKSNATAYHVPEGHCYIYHPSFGHSVMSEMQVSTREIFPTILDNFSVSIPDYAEKPTETILS
jgi:predicted AlkP superfamily phosphohydrolase/phosphomutase